MTQCAEETELDRELRFTRQAIGANVDVSFLTRNGNEHTTAQSWTCIRFYTREAEARAEDVYRTWRYTAYLRNAGAHTHPTRDGK